MKVKEIISAQDDIDASSTDINKLRGLVDTKRKRHFISTDCKSGIDIRDVITIVRNMQSEVI